MQSRQGVADDAVLQSAKHTFFVEGQPNGLDVTVLQDLHPTRAWRVEPLGPSLSVRSVAEALHPHHPHYYFVVDRDEQSDEEVEQSWENFPEPGENNLLIWRRKELESYFLIPEWVSQSKYFTSDVDTLRAWILEQCQERLWVEAANRAVVLIRNQLKSEVRGLRLFKLADFQGCAAADVPGALVERLPLDELNERLSGGLSAGRVEALFAEALGLFAGQGEVLVWGQGAWFELMSAKEIFRSMINQWFRVVDVHKQRVTGREAERVVARELLKDHRESMPTDFGELVRLFEEIRRRP